MSRKNIRQAKQAKQAKKAAKRDRRESSQRRDSRPPFPLLSGLVEVEKLIKENNLDAAVEVLEELKRRYPRRLEVFGLLLKAYHRQNDMWSYQAVCERLVELDRESVDLWLALAGTALGNGQLAKAHWAFNHILSRWPDNPEADKARDVCDDLEDVLRGELATRGMPQEDGFDLLVLHDEINLQLQVGEYDKVVDVASRLLARCPTFAPALNNRSQAYFRSGHIERAIADGRRVLEFDAGNFHALANLARFLCLGGQFDEAQAVADRLKRAESDSPEFYVKQAESFAFLGDWQGVLDALKQAESSAAEVKGADMGMLYHVAGAAAAELGQLDVARNYWKRAVKRKSVTPWAQENLDDLKRPPGERNGPWAFPLDYWIPRPVIERLMVDMERAGPKAKEADVRRRVRKFFEQHPYLERLAPLLLERGDPAAKEFVVGVASLGQFSWIPPALREFAFGRRGTDRVRHQAAMRLLEAGALSPGLHPMWKDGALADIYLTRVEITPEPTDPLPEDIEPLATEAWQAIGDGDGTRAEALLDMAIQFCPDHPSLAYNRAVAIRIQGREEEAMSVVRELHARHPDYLFARVRLAENAVGDRDFKAARELLDPLMTRSRFHHSEYAAFCHAHITLLVAEGETEGARRWLQIWEDVAPDDPRVDHWKARLKRPGLFGKLFRRALPGISDE